MIKGQVKRHPLQQNVKIYVNDQLSFLRGGPIQSIFVCVMKIVILENISKFLKSQIIPQTIFGETHFKGNYQNGVLENRY